MNAISAAKMRRNLEFATPYTCLAALREGSTETRVSALVMGFGNMMHKQVAKGLLFLAAEIAYIAFMVLSGFHNLAMLGSLGTVERQEVWNEELQVFTYTQGDQSILLLLYGLATIILTGVMFWIWRGTLKSAYKAECLDKAGKHLNTLAEDLKSLLDDNLYRLLMTPPMIFIGALTILPLVFMICMAFTNYSKIDNHLVLFDWVGLQNFATLFDSNSVLGSTFWSVLVWTLVWAFFATFTNFFGGVFLAMFINDKKTKFPKLWRTLFVITIAVPQFVTLLLVRNFFGDNGIFNTMMSNIGVTDFLHNIGLLSPGMDHIPFLTSNGWAQVMIILINIWVGVPYQMLIATGVLMNIPGDMLEAARIDGANPVQMFFSIKLPYLLSVQGPALVTDFVKNINNFNVIYLLTQDVYVTTDQAMAASSAKEVDLLVTWLFRLTQEQYNYKMAAVIGIMVFIICAVFTVVCFRFINKKEATFS